jgi:hypothetical protein
MARTGRYFGSRSPGRIIPTRGRYKSHRKREIHGEAVAEPMCHGKISLVERGVVDRLRRLLGQNDLESASFDRIALAAAVAPTRADTAQARTDRLQTAGFDPKKPASSPGVKSPPSGTLKRLTGAGLKTSVFTSRVRMDRSKRGANLEI